MSGWSVGDWALAMLAATCGLDLLRRVLNDLPAIVRWWRS